jgi:hypothetical protein
VILYTAREIAVTLNTWIRSRSTSFLVGYNRPGTHPFRTVLERFPRLRTLTILRVLCDLFSVNLGPPRMLNEAAPAQITENS